MHIPSVRGKFTESMLTCIVLLFLFGPCFAEQDIDTEESSFLWKLKSTSYEEIEGPKEPVTIRWDFSREETYTYSFESTMQNQFKTGVFTKGKDRSVMQTIVSAGKMLIESRGDRTADLVIRDMTIEMLIDKQDEEPEKTEIEVVPPQIIQGLNEEGLIEGGDLSVTMFVKTLFAMPSQPLTIGETEKIPAAVPFNVMGSPLQVKGTISITLERFVEIDGRAHAELKVDFDFARLDVPEELDADSDYRALWKGVSVHYFDLERKLVVSGASAILNRMSATSPMPMKMIDKEEASDLPEMLDMNMESDNFTHFSIIK